MVIEAIVFIIRVLDCYLHFNNFFLDFDLSLQNVTVFVVHTD